MAVFLTLVAVYSSISLIYLPQEVFWSPDTGMKYLQAANIRWEGGPAFSIYYPGKVIDPALEYVPFGVTFYVEDEGEVYGIWSSVFPLLSRPFLELAGYQGLVIPSIVSGALTSLIGYWLLSGHSVRLKVLAALIIGLSTPVFIYSLLYWEHIVYTFLVLLGTAILLTQIEKVVPDYKRLLLAGFIFGLAIYFRPEGLLFAMAIAIAWFLTKELRQLKEMALAGAAFTSSLALYFLIDHFVPIGTRTHVQGFTAPGGPNLEYIDSHGLGVISNFLVGTNVSGSLSFLFVVSLGSALAVLSLKQSSPMLRSVFLLFLAGLLIASTLILIASQDYQVFDGMLSASPVLVFGLFLPYARRPFNRPTFLGLTALLYFLLSAMSLTLLAFNSAPRTIGGLEWGPRFFLPFYPLMSVVSVHYLAQLLNSPSRLFKTACLTLFLSFLIVGVGIQLTGVQRIHEDNQNAESIRGILATLPDQTVVTTDLWWLSTGPLAFDFTDRKLLLVPQPDQLPNMVAQLQKQGISKFWLVSFTPPESHLGLEEAAEQGFLFQVGERRYAKDGLCFCEILMQRSTQRSTTRGSPQSNDQERVRLLK